MLCFCMKFRRTQLRLQLLSGIVITRYDQLNQMGVRSIEALPYSPDFLPRDFNLIRFTNQLLFDKWFDVLEEIVNTLKVHILKINQTEDIRLLPLHSQRIRKCQRIVTT